MDKREEMVYLDRMDFWGRLVISYSKPVGTNIFITVSVKGASGENGQVLLGKKGATGSPGEAGLTGPRGEKGEEVSVKVSNIS